MHSYINSKFRIQNSKLLLPLFLVSGLLFAWDVSAAIISKPPSNFGLISYWSMNEGTGIVAGDSSGNGNNGTLINGPTWTNGKLGKALDFDGSNNDYVRIAPGSSGPLTQIGT